MDQKEDSAMYRNQAEKVKKAFIATFQDKKSGLINDGEDTSHKSQHANMFALTFGLIPDKDIESVVNYVKEKICLVASMDRKYY